MMKYVVTGLILFVLFLIFGINLFLLLLLAGYVYLFWYEVKDPGCWKKAWHKLMDKPEVPVPDDLWEDFNKSKREHGDI